MFPPDNPSNAKNREFIGVLDNIPSDKQLGQLETYLDNLRHVWGTDSLKGCGTGKKGSVHGSINMGLCVRNYGMGIGGVFVGII